MAASAREVAQAYADCLVDGDFERLVSLHHPDMVCSLLGDTIVSGRYVGRDAFFAHTFEYVLGRLEQGDEQYLKDARVACAGGDYAVLLLRGGLPTRIGGRYDQNYMQCFRVVGGQVVENHEMLDSVMLEAQVYGKHLKHQRPEPQERLAPRRLAAHRTNDGTPVKPVANAFCAALIAKDLSGIIDLLAVDAVVQIAGSNPHSGVIRSREAAVQLFGQEIAGYRANSLRWRSGPRLICHDDEAFCILAELTAELADGSSFEQTIGLLAHCRAGRVNELYIYFDTAAQERQRWSNPLDGNPCERAVPRLSIQAAPLEDIIKTKAGE
jgi:ketosteroid isomerase-like protein